MISEAKFDELTRAMHDLARLVVDERAQAHKEIEALRFEVHRLKEAVKNLALAKKTKREPHAD